MWMMCERVDIMQTNLLAFKFHFRPMPHPHNVRKRIRMLKDYIDVSPGKPYEHIQDVQHLI